MFSVKTGTQTWSKATQESALKSDSVQRSPAGEQEPALAGQENVGELLNKVADPNWVDPQKTRKVGNNQLDKDAFLKLMLAQMKYQDPTNPMQSHEMAAQLAQFTSLEQLNNINSTLEGMKNQQNPQINYQALNFIGKMVSGDSSKIARIAGDKDHEVNFNLMSAANSAKVTIKDEEGNAVKTIDLSNLKKGPNLVRWNGLTEDGIAARPGEYRVSVEAVGSNGQKIVAETAFEGKITGLNFTPAGPVLLVGQQTVQMKDVKKIVDPAQSEAKPAPENLAPGEAKAPGNAKMIPLPKSLQTPLPAQAQVAKDPAVKGNMGKVAMNRKTYNEVKNQGGT